MEEELTLDKKAREIALKFKENVLEYKIDLKKMIQHFGSQFNLLQANEFRLLLSQQDEYYHDLIDTIQGQKLINKIICYILFSVNNPDFDKNCTQISYTDISNFINFQNITSPIWSGFSKFKPDELKILQQISSKIHGKQQNTYQSLLNSLGINGTTLNKQSIRHLIKKNTRNTSEEQINSIFTKLDENGDGKIDIYEFEKNLTDISNQTQERLQKFQIYIEKIILSILQQYGRITPQIVQQQFKELSNSQNKVEIKNFVQYMSRLNESMDVLEIENFFYLMDQDGDGSMDFSEFTDMISSKVEQLNKSKKLIFRKIIDAVISNGLYLKQFIQDGFFKVLQTDKLQTNITSLDLYNFMIQIVQDLTVKKLEIDDIMNNYNVLTIDTFLNEIENFYVSTIQREKIIHKILYEIIQNMNEGVMEKLINGDQEKLLNSEEFENLCTDLMEDSKNNSQKLYFHLQQNYFGITTTKNLMNELEKFYATDYNQFQEAQQIISQLVEIIFIKQYVLEDLFDQFDLNQDKELSFIEFSMLLQQVKFDLTQEQSQIIFNWFDLNLDGTIQKDEFVQTIKHYFTKIIEPNQNTYEISYILAKNLGELQDQNQFYGVFQSYDRNHDNSLEFLEFGSLIRDIYPKATEKDMTIIFQLMTNSQDINSYLTFDQFVQGSLNLTQLIRARYNVVLECPIQRAIYQNKRSTRDWDYTEQEQTEYFIENVADLEDYTEQILKKYKKI